MDDDFAKYSPKQDMVNRYGKYFSSYNNVSNRNIIR